MEIKIFEDKKITIRKLSKKDIKNVKKFQNFINSLVEEEAKILVRRKKTFKEEKEWIEKQIKQNQEHKSILLVAEYNDIVLGTIGIDLNKERKEHVAEFGITIRQGYRGIGLGKYLIDKVIKLVKKELKPIPKIIRLSVYPNNKPAIKLYKKYGFKKVAVVPKQYQYKGKLIDEIIMLLHL